MYEDIDKYVDRLAEGIRQFGTVPAAMRVYENTSIVQETLSNGAPSEMLRIVGNDAEVIAKLASETIEVAGKHQGVVNILGDLAETLDNIVYLSRSSL
jgi:DNA-binding ferritin-like protein